MGYGLDADRKPGRLPRDRWRVPALTPGAQHDPARGARLARGPRSLRVRRRRAAVRLVAAGGRPGHRRPHAHPAVSGPADPPAGELGRGPGRGAGRQLPGVNGEHGDAEAFAAAWSSLTGAGWQEFRRSRLFQLGQLTPPDPAPPGAARVASAADRELLESWLTAFQRELA